ncbi:MAG: YdeI/OmpD-associated family protein [Saprospiraceae bacterium]|nr:YdeI/OmpD-associated family protein [Saprospiraceae bacterium]
MELHKDINTFYASGRAEWRKWLSENWDKEKPVFLIIYKKESGIPSITYDEAVDEALCFGWVDSKVNKRDEKSWYQYFTKRKPKSNWSKINKNKVERLIKENLMSAPGLVMVEHAIKTGTWTALDDVENLVLPKELIIELEKNPIAFQHWEKFPGSAKKGILQWISTAKKMETKLERIRKTIAMAAENKRAFFET